MPNLVPVGQIASEKMSVFDIFCEKCLFLAFLKVTVTLTFGQNHNWKYSWKPCIPYYHHAKFGTCRSNNLWENVFVWLFFVKNAYFGTFSRSLWPWPSVKTTDGRISKSPLLHTSFMPILVPVGKKKSLGKCLRLTFFGEKCQFLAFLKVTATLTFGQGHRWKYF